MKKVVFSLLIFSSQAFAVNVNLMQHSHSPIYMQTEDTLTNRSLPNETLIFSAYYNYVQDPLVITTPDRSERIGTVVQGINALHFGVGYQASNRFLLGLSSFAANVYTPNHDAQYAMGDTKIIGKYRLTGDRVKDSFALIPEIEMATGNKDLFVSNGGVGTGLKLAYERDLGFMRLTLNTGYMYNSQAKYKDLDYRNRINLAAGAHVPLNDQWGVIAEGTTSRTFKRYQNPGEFYLGARYEFSPNLALNAGSSIGNIGGTGSSELRVLAGLKYVPHMNQSYHFKTLMSMLTEREKRLIKRIAEIREEIKFDHDSHELNETSQKALDHIAQLLRDESHDFQRIIIEGHANRVGDEEYNLTLSKARARVVRDYLITKGIEQNMLDVKGYGESRPKPIEEWAQAKVENRRVEFHVEK
ncbi:MAG: hypothetical protein COW00_19020 [Bdellovibrio sp. CG12_big_fil_rev_8_21_14_0_65_39_13]|nr:MAG: hypothetical protein COW78_17255 [Bdellovibrio sp. CG22_combo_CG10-13_8_21_14_all_39_27]PIQ57789.1 MAG: hypothetical protein COW00_19020 [Bdellovibrio sp. CG12_big_fil_rev_8_21_14_0_65_39_13]PIR34663.1 MAG: hypothetical protein COV37_12070 [Bdellovibrio sp. CG11_big_fil_rev_8_21_14_0_20_39_38]PJB54100.1 MAG: hypothetical protein CO099_03430 [Bdellovibrio sp. CG_4_9_14_3_um_filter_39_7]